MAEEKNTQSEAENIDELLTADDPKGQSTETQQQSNLVDLGDGSKVSVDELKVAYQKIKEYQGLDPSFVKQSLEFKQWLSANPDKAQKIRDIANAIEQRKEEAMNEEDLTPEQKMEKRLEMLEQRDADREFTNDMNTAKSWVEKRGIKWDNELKEKVRQRIAQTGDEVEDALKVVCFEGLASAKPKPKTTGSFIEGKSGGQKSFGSKPVTQMSDAETRESIAKELNL